jgi:hypothetical protein
MEMKPTDVCITRGILLFTTLYVIAQVWSDGNKSAKVSTSQHDQVSCLCKDKESHKRPVQVDAKSLRSQYK